MMLWASFMGKNQKNPNRYKTEKGAIMNEGTRNQLEVKLKKMLDHHDQAKAKEKQPISNQYLDQVPAILFAVGEVKKISVLHLYRTQIVCRGGGITRRRKPLRNGGTKVSGFHNIFYN
jgi:hypothetical protein